MWRKVVSFFDELPWLATRRSGCLEELELFWNRYASRASTVVLIVCGSGTRKALRLVMISARGLTRNKWSDALIDATVTLEDLFVVPRSPR